MTEPTRGLVVVGTLTLDTVEVGGALWEERCGGSALYAAAAASILVPTTLSGVVGSDFPMDALDFLRSRGADLSAVQIRPGPTFRWHARYDARLETRFTVARNPGVSTGVMPFVSSEFPVPSPSVLLGSVDPAVQRHFLDQLPAHSRVGLDTMAHWARDRRAELDALLRRTDVLFASEEELGLLGGDGPVENVVKRLLSLGPSAIVVKRGSRGAMVTHRDHGSFALPAASSSPVVDPTGAGDALAGAFMATLERLGAGSAEDFRQALLFGTAAASFAVEHPSVGGLRALTSSDLERRVEGLVFG